MEYFTDSTLEKEMVVLENSPYIRWIRQNEENGCIFEGQRKETWIYTWLAWLIAVKERMLQFYLDQTQFINTLALDAIQVS